MDIEPRSRGARERAEEALIRLAVALGERSTDVVIIGGLNPDFLVSGPPVSHLGTTDVDVLVEVGVHYDREDLDFG